MGKLRTTKQISQEEGIESAILAIKDYFISGDGKTYTKSILGKKYHQKLYMYEKLGYWPQIQNPRTFNEKILHRKLYTDNELFSIVEDKWRVREYVEEKVGGEILPEVYHVTVDPETIPFGELPDKYVIKPTHSCGDIIFIDEDEKPDQNSIRELCHDWLDKTHGQMLEEYWYGNIKPRILIEEKLEDRGHHAPRDFKLFVFHGEVKAVGVYQKASENTEKTVNFYTKDWTELDITKKEYEKGNKLPKPETLDDMIDIAETVGNDFEHIRVDLYTPNNQRVVFGELTVATGSGGNPFVPRKYDFEFGSYW